MISIPNTFAGAVRSGLVKTFDYEGRASRGEYWWFAVFSSLVISLFNTAAGAIAAGNGLPFKPFNLVSLSISFLGAVPLLSLAFRRRHDLGLDGRIVLVGQVVLSVLLAIALAYPIGWAPFGLAFLAYGVWSLTWIFRRGETGPNRFGADPLAPPVDEKWSFDRSTPEMGAPDDNQSVRDLAHAPIYAAESLSVSAEQQRQPAGSWSANRTANPQFTPPMVVAIGIAVSLLIGSATLAYRYLFYRPQHEHAPQSEEAGSLSIQQAKAAYERGNIAESIRLSRLLAEQGNADAQYDIGQFYYFGEGVTKDYSEAIKWYRLAAAQGHTGAETNLGVMYEKGLVVTQNYAESLKWYRLAAAQGGPYAQNNLAAMYYKGKGVTQDYPEALRWYRLAAAQGLSQAQITLGLLYEQGRGVTQDYAEAVKWYRLAAEQGDAGAAGSLAINFEYGRGVPQNYVNAYAWYAISAAQGDKSSAVDRDSLLERMTGGQIAAGQALASRCQQSNYKDCD
jgi:TPR repeat protein/uncharacterized membrane protein YhaH (DUF805 family)